MGLSIERERERERVLLLSLLIAAGEEVLLSPELGRTMLLLVILCSPLSLFCMCFFSVLLVVYVSLCIIFSLVIFFF